MFKKISRFIFLGLALSLFGASCISFNSSGSQGTGGGVFKSANRGRDWVRKIVVPTPAGLKDFGGTNITVLAIDPQDHLAIYAGTRENGLYYSYDGGESWQQVSAVNSGYVSAISVDQSNKCVIYVATGNRIVKSTDCNRTYSPIYNDAAPLTIISALALHPNNVRIMYAGTSKGFIVKSADGGLSWSKQADLRSKVMNLVIDPRTPTTVYAIASGRGIWRSINDGATFEDISDSLKDIRDGRDARRLIIDRATPKGLLMTTRNKFLRSDDGGLTWSALSIVSPEGIDITAIAVNPNSSKDIYYGTATTFYRSIDAGQNWAVEKLPTRRQASALLVDPRNPEIIYLGVLEVKQ